MDVNIHNSRMALGTFIVLICIIGFRVFDLPDPAKREPVVKEGTLVKVYRCEDGSFSVLFKESDGDTFAIDGLTKQEAVYMRTGLK